MDNTKYPPDVCVESYDLTREWWDTFLKNGGPTLFHDLLMEAEAGEGISIDIKAKTNYGKKIPEGVTMMLLMRVALRTLAVGIAVERWCDAQEN